MAKTMKCPVCEVDLVMSDRQGVEIDYCPQCRGVWLDRGELDKIIERTASPAAQPQAMPAAQPAQYQPPQQPQYPQQYPPQQFGRQDNDYYYDKHGYKKRKKSILGEIFDF